MVLVECQMILHVFLNEGVTDHYELPPFIEGKETEEEIER